MKRAVLQVKNKLVLMPSNALDAVAILNKLRPRKKYKFKSTQSMWSIEEMTKLISNWQQDVNLGYAGGSYYEYAYNIANSFVKKMSTVLGIDGSIIGCNSKNDAETFGSFLGFEISFSHDDKLIQFYCDPALISFTHRKAMKGIKIFTQNGAPSIQYTFDNGVSTYNVIEMAASPFAMRNKRLLTTLGFLVFDCFSINGVDLVGIIDFSPDVEFFVFDLEKRKFELLAINTNELAPETLDGVLDIAKKYVVNIDALKLHKLTKLRSAEQGNMTLLFDPAFEQSIVEMTLALEGEYFLRDKKGVNSDILEQPIQHIIKSIASISGMSKVSIKGIDDSFRILLTPLPALRLTKLPANQYYHWIRVNEDDDKVITTHASADQSTRALIRAALLQSSEHESQRQTEYSNFTLQREESKYSVDQILSEKKNQLIKLRKHEKEIRDLEVLVADRQRKEELYEDVLRLNQSKARIVDELKDIGMRIANVDAANAVKLDAMTALVSLPAFVSGKRLNWYFVHDWFKIDRSNPDEISVKKTMEEPKIISNRICSYDELGKVYTEMDDNELITDEVMKTYFFNPTEQKNNFRETSFMLYAELRNCMETVIRPAQYSNVRQVVGAKVLFSQIQKYADDVIGVIDLKKAKELYAQYNNRLDQIDMINAEMQNLAEEYLEFSKNEIALSYAYMTREQIRNYLAALDSERIYEDVFLTQSASCTLAPEFDTRQDDFIIDRWLKDDKSFYAPSSARSVMQKKGYKFDKTVNSDTDTGINFIPNTLNSVTNLLLSHNFVSYHSTDAKRKRELTIERVLQEMNAHRHSLLTKLKAIIDKNLTSAFDKALMKELTYKDLEDVHRALKYKLNVKSDIDSVGEEFTFMLGIADDLENYKETISNELDKAVHGYWDRINTLTVTVILDAVESTEDDNAD